MEKEVEKILTDALCGKLNPDLSLKENVVDIAAKIRAVYAPIVKSLSEANDQNTQLLQEKLKLENDIIAFKNTIKSYENPPEDFKEEVVGTCAKRKYFYDCDIWEKSVVGCHNCEFFNHPDKHIDGQTK